MIPSFIIGFREVLEAALIIGIMLSYLIRIKQTKFNKIVYIGIVAGISASILGAYLFNLLANGFSGRAEQIFEGITMLIGAFLLTTVILWIMKQKNIANDLENKISNEITGAHKFGLFFLVFIAVLREGIETVIYLGATSFVSENNNLLGALIGMVTAIIFGYLIFISGQKINIKKFLSITSFILILFAAGLVAHGVHELQEAGLLPFIIEHVWDINPDVTVEGEWPLLHEKGHIGSIARGLLGYNGNPSLLEIISYGVYFLLAMSIWYKKE